MGMNGDEEVEVLFVEGAMVFLSPDCPENGLGLPVRMRLTDMKRKNHLSLY